MNQRYEPGRLMGCMFGLLSSVFFAIALLAGITSYVARGTSDADAEIIQTLDMRAGTSCVLGVVAALLAIHWYRSRR